MLTEEKDNLKQVLSRFPMYQKFHDVDACYSYKRMEVGDREKFLMKQKLCFSCYEPISKDHSRSNWKIIQKDCMYTSQRAKNQGQEQSKQ